MVVGNYRGQRKLILYSGKKAESQSTLLMLMSIIGIFLIAIVVAPYFLIFPILNIGLIVAIMIAGYILGTTSYNKNYKKYRNMLKDSQEELTIPIEANFWNQQ